MPGAAFLLLLFGIQPAGVFHDGLVFHPLVGTLHLFPIVPGGHLHNFNKAAVEAGNRMEAHIFRNIQNGVLCAPQQVTRLGNTGIVDKIQRRGTHNVVENPPEMGGTPVA